MDETMSPLLEGVLNRLWVKTKEWFSMSYDMGRTKELIRDYLEDGRIEELKNFLVTLRLTVDRDSHKGPLKKLGQMLLFDNTYRTNYLEYKRQLLPVIFWAAGEITKATGRKFDWEFYYSNATGQLAERLEDTKKYNEFYDMQRGVNPALQTLQVLNSMNAGDSAVGKFSNLHNVANSPYYNNPDVAANAAFNSK